MDDATMIPPPLDFDADDAERAYREWGCNCGPAALAACLLRTLDAIRPRLGDFERRGYINPTMMGAAIVAAGFRWRPAADWPTHGLVRVQWGGPWLNPGVPPGAAYARTHWVASKIWHGVAWVYDVNAGWQVKADWERETVPRLVAATPKADGTWTTTHRWEVRRSLPA